LSIYDKNESYDFTPIRYAHRESTHTNSICTSIFKGQLTRAVRICNNKYDLKHEFSKITYRLLNRGYEEEKLFRIFKDFLYTIYPRKEYKHDVKNLIGHMHYTLTSYKNEKKLPPEKEFIKKVYKQETDAKERNQEEISMTERMIMLKTRLEHFHLQMFETKLDGNCQFNSFPQQTNCGKTLREKVIHHIQKNETLLQFTENPDKWIKDMAKEGTYGDHVTLKVIATIFQIEILVLGITEMGIYTTLLCTPLNTIAHSCIPIGFIQEKHYVAVQGIVNKSVLLERWTRDTQNLDSQELPQTPEFRPSNIELVENTNMKRARSIASQTVLTPPEQKRKRVSSAEAEAETEPESDNEQTKTKRAISVGSQTSQHKINTEEDEETRTYADVSQSSLDILEPPEIAVHERKNKETTNTK
jgi:hypothetical protein